MSQDFGPYIIQTIGRRGLPIDTGSAAETSRLAAVNDRTAFRGASYKAAGQAMAEGRQAAFKRWLSQISHMLDEWEMELIGHAAPLSTFETIAEFKDILSREQADKP